MRIDPDPQNSFWQVYDFTTLCNGRLDIDLLGQVTEVYDYQVIVEQVL